MDTCTIIITVNNQCFVFNGDTLGLPLCPLHNREVVPFLLKCTNLALLEVHTMQWLREDFMKYLQDWQQEVNALPVKMKERQKFCLSRETMDGMKITGKI